MRNPSRRGFLQVGSLVSLCILSGCSFIQPDNSAITLEILNTDSSPHTIDIQFLQTTDDGGLSEESEYSIGVEGKDAQGACTVVREQLLGTDSYTVRVNIEGDNLNDHYHFSPRCDGQTEYLRISLLTDETSLDSFEFYQSCS